MPFCFRTMQGTVWPRCCVVNGFLWLTTLDHEFCHLECLQLKLQTRSWPNLSPKKDWKRLSFKTLCPLFDMETWGEMGAKGICCNYTLAEPQLDLQTTVNFVLTDQQRERISQVSIIVHKHWTIMTVLNAPITFCSQFLSLHTLIISLWLATMRLMPLDKCKTLCLQSHQLEKHGVFFFNLVLDLLNEMALFIPS